MTRSTKVKLPLGWSDYSGENPEGPPTFLRDLSDLPGPLQISIIPYIKGEIPNPTEHDLIELAQRLGFDHNWGQVLEVSSGFCAFGIYGTAVFSGSDFHRVQVWYLSNGKDFILATHICQEEPDPTEVKEAQTIVTEIELE